MRRTRVAFGFAVLAALALLCACSRNSDAENETIVPEAQVRIAIVEARSISEHISVVGLAEPSADGARDVTVPYEAKVQAVLVTPGEHVVKGRPLLRLIASPAAHPSPTQAAREADQAAAELARTRRLQSEGLATRGELRAAVNADAAAREQLQGVGATGAAFGNIIVASPIDGIVDQLPLKSGTVVAVGSMLARITRPDSMIVRFGIEPGDARRLAVGAEANVMPLAAMSATLRGRIEAIDYRVDPDTRLAYALVSVSGASHLLSGESVRGALTTGTHFGALTVPRSAVRFDGDRPAVFVVRPGKRPTAQRVPVVLGLSDDAYVEITSGLTSGQQLVVEGTDELDDGMALRVLGNTAP